jgi:hypothetical protein
MAAKLSAADAFQVRSLAQLSETPDSPIPRLQRSLTL